MTFETDNNVTYLPNKLLRTYSRISTQPSLGKGIMYFKSHPHSMSTQMFVKNEEVKKFFLRVLKLIFYANSQKGKYSCGLWTVHFSVLITSQIIFKK